MDASLHDTLTPFYHTTEGLKQGTFRKLTEQALALLNKQALVDHLQGVAPACESLPDLATSLNIVHRPPPDADVNALLDGLHPAHRRLALEELVAHRLG